MICMYCAQEIPEGRMDCPACLRPIPQEWSLLDKAYPPEDEIIKGVLESCGIPVLLKNREAIGAIQRIVLGPLAEVRIYVPTEKLDEAKAIMATQAELFEEDEPIPDSE
ncbi:MAG: putative signal transducing protein [Candidatus Saccharibacteria bacterium]